MPDRITGFTTFKLSVPTGQETRDPRTGELLCSTKKSWLFLKLETNSGLCGWGEGSAEWLVPAVEATLLDWKPLLIGRDPLPVSALTEDIVDRLPWRGGPVFGTALAAINMALYDIAGQAWQAPVHTLLGGKRRDKVQVYSGGADFDNPEQAAAVSRQVKEQGFAGIKGNPLEERTWPMDHRAVETSVACVAAMREAVGADFDILLDAHGSPLPELSLEFARQLAPHRPLFLEEPVKVGSLDALIEVSRCSPVPIATGEKLFSLDQFLPLIERRACSFLQPDIAHCFGLDHFLEIARAAERQQNPDGAAHGRRTGPLCGDPRGRRRDQQLPDSGNELFRSLRSGGRARVEDRLRPYQAGRRPRPWRFREGTGLRPFSL